MTTRGQMTAMDVLAAVLHQHLGDISRRGHMPGCAGGFWLGNGPRECSQLCRDAQRIVAEGEVRQMALGEPVA